MTAKPKPKDERAGIGMNADGTLNVVPPGCLGRRIAERDCWAADEIWEEVRRCERGGRR